MTRLRDERLDDVIRCLADAQRRAVVSELRASPGEAVSVTDLVDRLATEVEEPTEADRERLLARLHHVHLPKLDAVGAVQFETTTGRVRYVRDPTVERVADAVEANPALTGP